MELCTVMGGIIVIILQYVQIANHYVVHLKLILYINYTSIKKKQKQKNKNGSFTSPAASDIRRDPRMQTALKT